jgi:hypothetical protein
MPAFDAENVPKVGFTSNVKGKQVPFYKRRKRSGSKAGAWLAADGEVDRVGHVAEMMRAVVQRFRQRHIAALIERDGRPQNRLGEMASGILGIARPTHANGVVVRFSVLDRLLT